MRISLRRSPILPAATVLAAALLLAAAARSAPGATSGRPDEVLSWRHQILPQADYDRLVGEWKAYVDAHPNDVRALVQLGQTLRYGSGEGEARAEKVRSTFERAFRADSTDASAIACYVANLCINSFETAVDWKLAEQRLLRGATADPNYAATYYTLWEVALALGDSDTERMSLERMIDTGDMPRPLVDFGYNMLIGAPPNAIVFTNGDNDTYPPLAVQAKLGLRKDVSIVNVSLLNLPWYIRRIRDDGVPVGLDDAAIAGLTYTKERPISAQVQQALYDNLKRTGWPRPLCYSVTVPDWNKAVPAKRSLEGLQERVTTEAASAPGGEAEAFDLVRTRDLIDTRYRFEGITDPLVDWKRENAVGKLGANYAALLSRVGKELLEQSPPREGGPYFYKAVGILAFQHDGDQARDLLAQWRKLEPDSKLLPDAEKLIE